MITRTEYETLIKKVDKLSREMEDIRRMLLNSDPNNSTRSKEAWRKLMKLSKKVSAKWQGPSVTMEIRDQRNKEYE